MEMPYDIKRLEMVTEKERIARTALDLIDDGDTFILDAGSTTYALALLLNTKTQITVVTNDLKIAVKLAENPKINLICTGGVARTSVFSLQGAVANLSFAILRWTRLSWVRTRSIMDGTISNVNIEEVSIKQAMI